LKKVCSTVTVIATNAEFANHRQLPEPALRWASVSSPTLRNCL
jgi:hypothetical protein